MKFTRVDLEGKNGVAEIKLDGDFVRIFVKEFNGNPMVLDRYRSDWDASIYSIAGTIQKTVDGFVGTNSDVQEYFELLNKFFE